MKSKELSLWETLKSVSEGYANAKLDQDGFDRFRTALSKLFEKINAGAGEGEENQKNVVAEFLKDAYYKDKHDINTKDKFKIDLVIHTGKSSQTPVGVIIETKNPVNAAEMITADNLNAKALHQLVLYYFREKNSGNDEITHLIATNISEWFIFDAAVFKSLFYENTELVAYFKKHAAKKLDDNSTSAFYAHVERFVDENELKIAFTHFSLNDFKNAGEDSLIELYKILSPEHLLKFPFRNDSNTLNKKFYNELLYIVGLTEVGQNGKKLIERCKKGERQSGSLLENAIDGIVENERLENISQYGSNAEERLFNAALELAIIWVNRILFLKLMESQLLSYHQGDESYAFLTSGKIKNYPTLNDLFFRVLACKSNERQEDVKKIFEKVPYLNSSLFAPTQLEKETLRIRDLRDDKTIAVFSDTVLKDGSKKKNGKMPLLEYLFAFLDAYDFGSEKDNKFKSQDRLINASVLGLIFEKINGYKDGSFFTPGFITMYMCRETIRKAVVQKFNEAMKWDYKEFDELYNEIVQSKCRQKANEIINGLKICDPAVGSGHFLVSALNEIIALKSELGILQDSRGKLLNVRIAVENDELVIKDANDEQFTYRYPNNGDCQRVQETLFHEKQMIIENCLFGVDINPNSVAICRLRLWIELLKNAYYKNATELETLPNIDINIKCGNSLVSRFPLDADLKKVLKGKHTVEKYRKAVATYRNAKNKAEKLKMETLVADIKSSFRGELQLRLFGDGKEKENSKIYANAFEWRFEFPEVLNESGEFVGFDVLFANPPYGRLLSRDSEKQFSQWIPEFRTTADVFVGFILRGLSLIGAERMINYIVPTAWLGGPNYVGLRTALLTKTISEIVVLPFDIFGAAYVDTLLLRVLNKTATPDHRTQTFTYPKRADAGNFNSISWQNIRQVDWEQSADKKFLLTESMLNLAASFRTNCKRQLGDLVKVKRGVLFNRNLLTSKKSGCNSHPYFEGNVYRYQINYSAPNWVDFGSEMRERPQEFAWFEGERLLLRRLVNRQQRLMATLVHDTFITNKNLYSILPNGDALSLHAILGLLNSTLISRLYIESVSQATKDDFPQVTITDLLRLPVPTTILPKQSEKLDRLAVQVLAAKKNDASADTTALESEIDRLVYELYGLTDAEIEIVEGRNECVVAGNY